MSITEYPGCNLTITLYLNFHIIEGRYRTKLLSIRLIILTKNEFPFTHVLEASGADRLLSSAKYYIHKIPLNTTYTNTDKYKQYKICL